MGWNTVTAPPASTLFDGLASDTRFYFVHSYAARPGAALDDAGVLVTTTVHGGEFVAAVESGCLAATQFHPEKSGEAGARLLRNWVAALSTTDVSG
jgi:imidazole glycerol-phosphate synthase subunit HisH